MKNMVLKLLLIAAVIVFCTWSLLSKGLHLGRDLQGGVSLIYYVDTSKSNTPLETLKQTIIVLKDRINPTGQLDITMNPLGVDRIEIVMPLPSDEVKALQRAFREQLQRLVAEAEIPQAALEEALQQGNATQRFGGRAGSDRELAIGELERIYGELVGARLAVQEARDASVSDEQLFPLESKLAAAELEYERALQHAMSFSLSESRITRVLALPTTVQYDIDPESGRRAVDEATGKWVALPSQREVALSDLEADYPFLKDSIHDTLARYDAYQAKRKGFDDPEDLMRLLRGAGVLQFHIAVRSDAAQGVNMDELRRQLAESGPDHTTSTVAKWYPINDLKQWYERPAQLAALKADPIGFFQASMRLVAAEHDGHYYLLLYTTPDKALTHEGGRAWSLESTGPTTDSLGRPAVSFRLDAAGGRYMGRLTGANEGEQMAIVLDGQVYSAPRLKSQITRSGVIEGQFSRDDISYLTRVLAAGGLEATLSPEPIAINTLGPALGQDNLERGRQAFIISIIITAAIMVGYYFLAGGIAVLALGINALLIFGVMAGIDGTFTLPGMAGVVLSIAMAVDSNVLIYERMREEMVNNKEDLKTAVRLGYSRAMSAIIDGNVTGLIVSFVLLYTATTEVKGFAITMIIGVVATLFTSLFVTRQIYTLYTDYLRRRSLPMLPTVFPGVHKALEPHINWLGKRHIFYAVSIILCLGALAMFFTRGAEMYDTEFRGGIAMTMQTRMADVGGGEPADSTGRLQLSRPQVEERIRSIGEEAGPAQPALHQLRNASILTVGESTADFMASRFQIKVSSPPVAPDQPETDTSTQLVVDAVVGAFGDELDVIRTLTFSGSDQPARFAEHAFEIDDPDLGKVIGRPQVTANVREFVGGVALVIDDLRPAQPTEIIEQRINRMRQQRDFADVLGRKTKVVALAQDPADPSAATAVAIVVFDPNMTFTAFDFETVTNQLTRREWDLALAALTTPQSLEQVTSFSSAIAQTLAANAVVAIILSVLGMLIYIWMRFGSLLYSLATVVAVMHNVIICLGALALTHFLSGTPIAAALMLTEFRIDLNVIAALLTIIGYSLNDTIVILDRIRENRGKLLFAGPEIVNTSINQTFSRTILTGGSTILASLVLYTLGGPGIQPFAFTFLIGLLVGTYSSVAIAAPLVARGKGGAGGAGPRTEEVSAGEATAHRREPAVA